MSIKNVDSYVEAIKDLNCKMLAFEGIDLGDFMDISREINNRLNGYRKTSISVVTRKDGADMFQITIDNG